MSNGGAWNLCYRHPASHCAAAWPSPRLAYPMGGARILSVYRLQAQDTGESDVHEPYLRRASPLRIRLEGLGRGSSRYPMNRGN